MDKNKLLVERAKAAKKRQAESQFRHDELIEKLDAVNKLSESIGTLETVIEGMQVPDMAEVVKSIETIYQKIATIDLGQVDLSVLNEQITKLARHMQGIERAASRTIPTPEVTVKARDHSKEIASLGEILSTIGKKLPKSQDASDYVPYRRVIFNGTKLEFDDTRTSPGGVGGGGGGGAAVVNIDLPTYGVARIDDDADPTYYGFEDNDSNWYILQEYDANQTWLYFAGAGGIATQWANRASLAYADKGTIFGT